MAKKRILIIDDEEDFCLLLKSFLQDKGVEVCVAHNLAAGMKSIEEFAPDIVFLDNNLPDGLGWDRVVDITGKYPSLELNLISAYENKEFTYLRNYPVKFWEKPINLDELSNYSAKFTLRNNLV